MQNCFENCTFVELSQDDFISNFDCGDSDLDAYNQPEVLNFYRKNGFNLVFSTEEQERENLKKSVATDEPLHTRQMFYDMKRQV